MAPPAAMFAAAVGLLVSRQVAARNLTLGYLYYQSGPSAATMGDSWVQESFSQFKLAVQDVNANASILPNDTLTFVLADSAATETVALQGVVDLLTDDVVGIVGTGYSSALGFPAGYASMKTTPIVSPGSTAVGLTDKNRYPFLLRSIASDASALKAMAVVAAEFAWKRAAVLINVAFEQGNSLVLRPAMESLGVSCLSLIYESPDSPLAQQKFSGLLQLVANSGYRVLFLFPKTVDMQFWDSASKAAGLRTLKYVWISMPTAYNGLPFMRHTVNFIVSTALADSGVNQRRDDYIARWPTVSTLWNGSTHGFFNATTKLPFFGANAQLPTIWDTDYAAVGNGQPDIWGMYVYDAVWLYALAMDALQRSAVDPSDGAQLRDQLLRTRFQGVTGDIIFDEDTQDRMAPVSLLLTQNGSEPHLIARTTPQLGRGSPRSGPGSWCVSGCTDLVPASRAAIPWAAGSEPTDGRALDAAESYAFVGASFVDGELIEVVVQARDSFKAPPCREQCVPDTGGACAQCLASFAVYHDVQLEFTDMETGQRQLPAAAPNRTVDVASGRLVVALPQGIAGALVVGQREVELVVSYQNQVLAGGAHRIWLSSPDVRVCGDGQGYNLSLQACEPCPAGSFSKDKECREGLPCGCQKCARGRFSQNAGMSLCESCLAGTFAASEGLVACQNCTPGRASAEMGALSCGQCERGFFTDTFGSTACRGCPKGTFSGALGVAVCTPCPPTFTTDSRASTEPGDCLCAPGSRLVRDASAGLRCNACQEGFLCDGLGSPPRLAKGFYMPAGAALDAPEPDLYRCVSAVACPGQKTASSNPCAPRRAGLNCGLCEGSSYLSGDVCEPCEGGGGSVMPVAIIFSWLLSGAGLYYGAWKEQKVQRAGIAAAVLPSITLGIALTFVQQLGVFNTMNTAWPSTVKHLFDYFKLLLLDLSILRPGCSGPQGLTQVYLLRLSVPIVIAAMLMSWWLLSRPLHWATHGRVPMLSLSTIVNALAMTAQALFISLVAATVSLIECYENPNGVKTLRPYPFAVCGDSEQHALMPVFVLAVLVYIVGIFTVFSWALYVAPFRVTDTAFKVSTRALMFKFHVGRWWFGVPLLIRSMCLALVMVVEPSNGHVQFQLLVVVLVGALIMHLCCLPYADHYANILETVELGLLLLILTLGSWFLDDRDVDGTDSGMASALSAILIALVVCCFLIILVVLALALGMAAFPARVVAAQQAKAREATSNLVSTCEVVLGADEKTLHNLLGRLAYYDQATIQRFSNLMLLELCGLQAAQRSLRRLPYLAREVSLRCDENVRLHSVAARKSMREKLEASSGASAIGAAGTTAGRGSASKMAEEADWADLPPEAALGSVWSQRMLRRPCVSA